VIAYVLGNALHHFGEAAEKYSSAVPGAEFMLAAPRAWLLRRV
jgi:hypothetical protein